MVAPGPAALAPSRRRAAALEVESSSVAVVLRAARAPPPYLAPTPEALEAVNCGGGPLPAHLKRPELALTPPHGGTRASNIAQDGVSR